MNKIVKKTIKVNQSKIQLIKVFVFKEMFKVSNHIRLKR